MLAPLIVALLIGHAGQTSLKPIDLQVGETADVASYPVPPGTPISAKATDPAIVEVRVSKTAKVSVRGLKPGSAKVKITGVFKSSKTNKLQQINDSVAVTVKINLPFYYEECLNYLHSERADFEREKEEWKQTFVGLPTYYQRDGSINRIAEKDVTKAFLIATPAADKDILTVIDENIKTVEQAGSDFLGGKIDEVKFSRSVIGIYSGSMVTEWEILQQKPRLYISYFENESTHTHNLLWNEVSNKKYDLNHSSKSEAELKPLFKSLDDAANLEASKDFLRYVKIMQGIRSWILPKHQRIGGQLYELRRRLLALSKAKDDLYFQRSANVEDGYKIVWYGATFYGPATYPEQKRLGFRTSLSGYGTSDFVKKMPYPDVQVTENEPQMLGYMLPTTPPLPVVEPSGQITIGKLEVTLHDLIAAATARLQGQATDKSNRLMAIDESLPALVDRGQKAADSDESLAPLVKDLDQLFQATADLMKKLETIPGLKPDSETRALYANRNEKLLSVIALQSQLLDMKRAGKSTRAIERTLENEIKSLEAIEDTLGTKLGPSDTANYYREIQRKLRLLRQKLFILQEKRSEITYERTSADQELRRVLEDRIKTEDELISVAESIRGLNFDLTEIQVVSGGKEVFHASPTTKFSELDKLNRSIEEANKVLPELEQIRLAAKKDFMDASSESIQAGDELASLLNLQAYEKMAIDGAFHLYDIVYKGFKSGGYAGMLAEASKKLLEALVYDYDNEFYKSPLKKVPFDKIDANSIEAQVKKEFGLSVNDSLRTQEVIFAVHKRAVKDSLSKWAKERILNPLVGQKIFTTIDIPWRMKGIPDVLDSSIHSPEFVKECLKQNKFVNDGKLAFAGKKKLDLKLSGIFEGVLKDGIKIGLKAILESKERAAWRKLFETDVRARYQYTFYKVAMDSYWSIYDSQEKALLQKANLMIGMDPSGFKIDHSDPFSRKDSLQVKLVWKNPPTKEMVKVILGQLTASGRDGKAFSVFAGSLKEYQKSKVGLEIR